MQTCATLVCNTKNNDEQSIICVNYVLSGPQYGSIVMSKEQVSCKIKAVLKGKSQETDILLRVKYSTIKSVLSVVV
jgi:hypothetical protein